VEESTKKLKEELAEINAYLDKCECQTWRQGHFIDSRKYSHRTEE